MSNFIVDIINAVIPIDAKCCQQKRQQLQNLRRYYLKKLHAELDRLTIAEILEH